MRKKSVLIILPSEKFNEAEYSIVTEALKKTGINYFISSDAADLCSGANGMKVKSDVSLYNINAKNFDGIIFIGGEGAKKNYSNARILNAARTFNENKKIVAAICASPVILAKAGILKGIKAVCFPPLKEELESEGAVFVDEPAAVHKNIITARDPQSAYDFAERITGKILEDRNLYVSKY